ncbi:hypothetical protein Tco_1466727 [Tanacetum coccineum]
MPSTHDWPMIGLGIASVAPKGVIACVIVLLEGEESVEFDVAIDLLCMNTPYLASSSFHYGLSLDKSISDSSASSVSFALPFGLSKLEE